MTIQNRSAQHALELDTAAAILNFAAAILSPKPHPERNGLRIGDGVVYRHPASGVRHENMVVVGYTTTGVYISPRDSLTPTDLELARRGNLPRACEWVSEKHVMR